MPALMSKARIHDSPASTSHSGKQDMRQEGEFSGPSLKNQSGTLLQLHKQTVGGSGHLSPFLPPGKGMNIIFEKRANSYLPSI